ncbi:MAG: FAD:protein FMN transferase [Pseudomonadota bacterium]
MDLLLIYRSFLILLLGIVVACDSTPKPQVVSGATMGTTYSVALYDTESDLSLAAMQADIDSILDGVNAVASTYRDDSELSHFNDHRSTEWQPTSAVFCSMVERALAISRDTDGAFDLTVAPLVDLWGFGAAAASDTAPSDDDVIAALRLVGYENLETDCTRPAVRKRNADARLDLSAWAKGHAADRIASYLDDAGFANFMAEVGGELKLSGRRVNNAPYRIALQHPASQQDLTHEVFELTDTGVATSGDYHNYYEVDGERFSHTIDPRTGRPVTHSLSTVSVIAESTADADAYATALLVMGPERGYTFAVEHDIAAYMTEYSGNGVKTRETPAFTRIARVVR